MFILDSDHLTFLQRKKGAEFANLRSRLDAVPDTSVCATIISFHEQIGGWYKHLARPKNQRAVVFAYQMLQRVITEFSEMQVSPFDDAAGAELESIRKQGFRTGTMDLRIAGIAIANDMTLLTRTRSISSASPDCDSRIGLPSR